MSQPKPQHAHGRVLLHEVVAERLRRDIESAFYPRGTYLPSEAELCARFKVSRVTLRRALSSLSAAGLTKPEAGIGHRVGGRLVTTQEGEGSLVAVLAPYAEGASYFAELVGGLEHTLADAGLHLAVYSTDPRGEQTSEQVMAWQVDRLLRVRPRAVVVCGQRRPADRAYLQKLVHASIRVVAVDDADPAVPADLVGTDDRLASLMVTDWLWRWSGGVVGIVYGREAAAGLSLRQEGFRLALEGHGVPPESAVEVRLGSSDDAASLVRRLLSMRSGERLGVFYAGNALPALAASLTDAHGLIGAQVAVGHVASPPWLTADTSLPVAAARWAGARMGESAGKLLLTDRGEDRVPQRLLLAPRLAVDAAYEEDARSVPLHALAEERR